MNASPAASRPSAAIGIGGLLLATLSWGGVFHITKHMLPFIDAFWQTVIRFSGAAVILMLLLAVTEGLRAWRFEGRAWAACFYGTLGYTCFNFLVFFGLNYTPAEHGAIMVGTMPIMLIVVNWLWHGQKPGNVTMGCVALALLGAVLVVTRGHPAALAVNGPAMFGDGIELLGVLGYAVYTLGAQRFPGWSPLRYAALTCVMAVPGMIVIAILFSMVGIAHLPSLATVGEHWVGLAFQTLFGSALAMVGWNLGTRALGPLLGVLFINLVPVTAFTVGVLLGNRLVPVEVLGALCVIAALLINNLYVRRTMALA